MYNFATMEYQCHCCGEKAHKSPQCRIKGKILNAGWAFNKATVNFMKGQQIKSESTAESIIKEKYEIG